MTSGVFLTAKTTKAFHHEIFLKSTTEGGIVTR
jgi:hypothetical protein